MRLADRWANSIRASVPGDGPSWLQALRGAAAQEFLHSGLPGNKDEAWKYTSLRRLEDIYPALGAGATAGTGAAWRPAVADTADFGFRVHAGRVESFDLCSRKGVTVMHLDQALMQPSSSLLDHLRCLLEKVDVHGRGRAFEALNTAMLEHGVLVHVAAGIDAGRCLAQWAQGGYGPSRLDNFRLVLMLDPGARLSLVEQYQGLEDREGEGPATAHALSLVMQIELSAGAALHHVMLQNESAQNVLLTSIEVNQGEGSSYRFGL
jgi:Fe-S cluster assembly protein SufD